MLEYAITVEITVRDITTFYVTAASQAQAKVEAESEALEEVLIPSQCDISDVRILLVRAIL